MPVKVVKKDGKWAIVETATGHVKGFSDSKRKAHISASYRNAAWKRKHG